jgi:DNA polymerase-1
MQQFALICDFSHFFHVAHHPAVAAGPNYETIEVTIENVEGKLRTMERELRVLRVVGYDIVFVEDRPPKRKCELLPTYRHTKVNPDLVSQKAAVKEHLVKNGYRGRFCHSPDNEADDAIASLCRTALATPQLHVIIVTGDRDLWQLIGPRVSVYNPIKRSIVIKADIDKAFRNCQPRHIPLYKALWGDAGDSVPNVMPFMQRHLMPLVLQTNGTLEHFEKKIELQKWYLNTRCYEKYLAALPDIRRNYELVKLDDSCPLVWE